MEKRGSHGHPKDMSFHVRTRSESAQRFFDAVNIAAVAVFFLSQLNSV